MTSGLHFGARACLWALAGLLGLGSVTTQEALQSITLMWSWAAAAVVASAVVGSYLGLLIANAGDAS